LKGFKRVHIPAGQAIVVTLKLKADELRYWNEQQHAFVLEPGMVTIMVGGASDDIRIQGKVEVKNSKQAPAKRTRN
jgi:beta-glucosidase